MQVLGLEPFRLIITTKKHERDLFRAEEVSLTSSAASVLAIFLLWR
jgi:hypothetical protein